MTDYAMALVAETRRKFYYTVADLRIITGYGKTKASHLMKKILEVSDSLGYGRGRCLKEDFEEYLRYNKRKKQEELKEKEDNEQQLGS